MTYDVTQWLAEIRTLQRQLADALKERDQAYNSAANWQRLYETEARQRRETVLNLDTSLVSEPSNQETEQSLTVAPQPQLIPSTELSPDASSVAALQAQLQHLTRRCHTLEQQLAEERLAHARTRQTLTTALGETFASLKPE